MKLKCLFLFSITIVALTEAQLLVISVDPQSGTNSPQCVSHDSSPASSCQTLGYALQQGAQKVVASQIILLSEGIYNLNDHYTFTNKAQFEIIGPQRGAVIQCRNDSNEAGLSFEHSNNTNFKNVKFIECGAYHNSTSNSYKSLDPVEFLEFEVTLYFIFCINVTLDTVTVFNSSGMGVVFYSTVGRVLVVDSVFEGNKVEETPMEEETLPGGGGIAVEFIYCIPGDEDCNMQHGSSFSETYSNGYFTDASYTFQSCIFTNNHGNTTNVTGDSFIIPHGSDNVALGRGGGLLVLYKGNVTNIPITINDCLFSDNIAVWGGGILIEFQDHSRDNMVSIINSQVIGNKCSFTPCTYQGTGGGGVRVQFASFENNVRNNMVHFNGVNFTNNIAYFGGGVSLFTFPANTAIDSNYLIFEQCTWSYNSARLGSAIDLSQWNVDGLGIGQVFLVPVFHSCTFDSNNVQYTSDNFTGTPGGIGALYTDTVPIKLTGENTFISNNESALASLDAAVQFSTNSKTTFKDNTGRIGGAVILFSKAFLKLESNSKLLFTNNRAGLFGGAIYWESVGDHQLLSSRNCFIRYNETQTDPTDWDVYLKFENNTASLTGQTIYGTSLLGCLWGGKSYDKLLNPEDEYDYVFCWNTESRTIWDYSPDDCHDPNIIASSPGYYAVSDGNFTSVQCGDQDYDFDVVPGKPQVLNVRMLDDRLKPLAPNSIVFSYHIDDVNHTTSTNFTTYENTSYYGRPGQVSTMYMATIPPRVITTKVNLNFTPCPPGFVTRDNHMYCQRADFPYIRIYSNFSADIQFGYWLGYAQYGNDSKDLYVTQCLVCPWYNQQETYNDCNISSTSNELNYLRLPDSVSDLDCMFCRKLNRTGILCSDCIEGYCTAFNSHQFKCIEESRLTHDYREYSWLLYIIWEYVPLTIMLIIVFLFNLSVTSGPANAFVFFAQVISTTFSADAQGQINNVAIVPHSSYFSQIYKVIYGIWNLEFFDAIQYEGWLFCLSPNIKALQITALNYIAALYPLIIILLVVFLVYLYNNNYRVVVYTFRPFHWMSARCLRRLNFKRSLMDSLATFLILSYVKFAVTACYLLYPNPLVNSTGDADILTSYFDGNIKYFSKEYLPYLLMSLLAVLWCIILPSILLFYSIRPCYICLQRTGCHWLQPGTSLQHFLNSFHHCFKDGTNGEHDRRYFAAVYFILKFLLISTYATGLDWTRQYIFQQIICTLGLLVVGVLQPYKYWFHNFLDMVMFSLLSVINILAIYNMYQQAINSSLSKLSLYVQFILIFIPLGYLLCYLLVLFLRPLLKKRKEHQSQELESSFHQFMDDVETEDRLRSNHYYGTIHEDDNLPAPSLNSLASVQDEGVIENNIMRDDMPIFTRKKEKKRRFSTEPIFRSFRQSRDDGENN